MLPKTMSRKILVAAMLGAVSSLTAGAALADHHAPSEKKMMEHAGMDHHGKSHIMQAITSPDRPEADKARDEARMPSKVMKFAGIKPGMTVVDLNAGGGWYSELLSRAIGDEGTLYVHNGPFYWGYIQNTALDKYTSRFGNNRLSNVKELKGESEALSLPDNSVDVVITVLAYHDYFFLIGDRTEPADYAGALASIKKALKPGGSFIVIDHVAPAGTGTAHAGTTHRIDPETVKGQVLAAGFTLAETSDALAHGDDDHTVNVFDPSIRGKTDRFIYKFTKGAM